FPASDAEVHLVLGDQRLETSITYHDYSVLAEAWIEGNEEEEGTTSLKCSVSLGNEIRKTGESVIINSVPAVSRTLSPPEISEWPTVTVECEAHPAGPLGPRAQLQLNASAMDSGRSSSCSAELEVAGLVVQKHQTLELRVLCPRLDQRVCLGNWSWQEGSEQTLKCEARGNPIPKLNCSRKGDRASLPIGDLRPIKREVAGTYLCRATSARGEVIREVVVNVLLFPNDLILQGRLLGPVISLAIFKGFLIHLSIVTLSTSFSCIYKAHVLPQIQTSDIYCLSLSLLSENS
ncbi:hypothetical protein FD754_024579, partial [Muntiacus muntjak]